MSKMELTVEEVRRAYKKIGFEPAQMEWINLDLKTCCPLTAVVIARGKTTPEDFATLEEELEGALNDQLGEWLGESSCYVVGFTQGFDGEPVGWREALGGAKVDKAGCALGRKVRWDLAEEGNIR